MENELGAVHGPMLPLLCRLLFTIHPSTGQLCGLIASRSNLDESPADGATRYRLGHYHTAAVSERASE